MTDEDYKIPEQDPDDAPMSDDDAINDWGEDLRQMRPFRNNSAHPAPPLSKVDELQREVRSLRVGYDGSLTTKGDGSLMDVLKEFSDGLISKYDQRFRRLDVVLKEVADASDNYKDLEERDRNFYAEEITPIAVNFLNEVNQVLKSLRRMHRRLNDELQSFLKCLVRCLRFNDNEVLTEIEINNEILRTDECLKTLQLTHKSCSEIYEDNSLKRFFNRLESEVGYWDSAFGESRWFFYSDVEKLKNCFEDIDVESNYLKKNEAFYSSELKRLMQRDKVVTKKLKTVELAKSSSVVPPEDVLVAEDPWVQKYVKALGGGPEVSKKQIADAINKSTESVRKYCLDLTPVAGYKMVGDKRVPQKGVRYDCVEVAMLLARRRRGK